MKCPSRFVLAFLLGLFVLPLDSSVAQRDEFYFGGGASARVKVVNQFGSPVRVYQLDRWNGWEWVGSVEGGSEASFRARPRQTLIVTNPRGEILNQTPVSIEGTTVMVGGERGYGRRDEGGYGNRGGGFEQAAATLKFKNKTGSTVMILRASRSGRSETVHELSSGKEWETRTDVGREWLVTDKRGRTMEKVVARGDQTITVRD